MGKRGDLNYFECGLVVGAKQGGLTISQTADLGSSHITIFGAYRE